MSQPANLKSKRIRYSFTQKWLHWRFAYKFFECKFAFFFGPSCVITWLGVLSVRRQQVVWGTVGGRFI